MEKDIHRTYKWRSLSLQWREHEHNECQRCKHRGKYKNLKGEIRYTRAVLVHHDFRVSQYPQYAFTPVVNGIRNFYSLCQSCHELEHEEERGMIKDTKELNEERW